MDQPTFDAFASALAMRMAREHPGSLLFVAVFPPGSFEGKRGPFSASTLPISLQPTALRMLATSLERNAATLIFTKVAGERASSTPIPEHQRPCNAECPKLHHAIDEQLTAYNAGRAEALGDVEAFNKAGKAIAAELRKLEAVPLSRPKVPHGK